MAEKMGMGMGDGGLGLHCALKLHDTLNVLLLRNLGNSYYLFGILIFRLL